MKSSGCLAILIGLVASVQLMARPLGKQIYDESADAQQDIRSAIAEAARSHKNVVLDFGANWCFDCHVLEDQMHKRALESIISKNYIVVNIDVGRFDKNVIVAREYHVPLEKGIPALAVLDGRGKLLYSQEEGQFEDARNLSFKAIRDFFERWKPSTPPPEDDNSSKP
jgi:thiol:disulfide interchange protein